MPKPAVRSGWLWLFQSLSGLLLLGLLGLHLIAQHFLAAGGLRTYAQVVAYLASPWARGLEFIFLFVVTGHAALGVRAVLLDLNLSPALERRLQTGLILLALSAILYGGWLLLRLP